MLKSCRYCGKIHNAKYICESKPKRNSERLNTKANEFRKTYKWKKKAREIKEDSKYLCSVCKEKDIYVYELLEVHHIVPLEEDTSKGLDNYNLICLCNECHRKAEKGKISRRYLLKLAKKREDN